MDHKIYYYRSPQSLEQQSAAQWGAGAAGTVPSGPVLPVEVMPRVLWVGLWRWGQRGGNIQPQNLTSISQAGVFQPSAIGPHHPSRAPLPGAPGTLLGAGRGQLSPPPWGRMGLTPELLARTRLYGDFQSHLKAAGEPEGQTRCVYCKLKKKTQM